MTTDFSAGATSISVSNGQAELLITLWLRELLGLEHESPIAGSAAGELVELLHGRLFHAGLGCQGFRFDEGPLAAADTRALFADAVHAVSREITRQVEDGPAPLPCPGYAFLTYLDPLYRVQWRALALDLGALVRSTLPDTHRPRPPVSLGPAAVLRYGQEAHLLRPGALAALRAGWDELAYDGHATRLRAYFPGVDWPPLDAPSPDITEPLRTLIRGDLLGHGPDRLGLGPWLDVTAWTPPDTTPLVPSIAPWSREERVVTAAALRQALTGARLDEEAARPRLVYFAREAFGLRSALEHDEQLEDISDDSYLSGEARIWVGEVLHRWRAQLAAERDGVVARLDRYPDDAPLLLWEERLS